MNRINQDIKNQAFQHFYLLIGSEGYLKKQYRDKLVDSMVNSDDTMNYYYAEGNNPDLNNIYELGETLPFFAERRVIVMENTGLLKKASDVNEHFEKFPDTTYVIMVEEKVDKRNGLYKWFGKHGYVSEMDKPDEKMLVSWVKKLCAEANKTIDDATIYYMIQHMGMEMYLLKNELEKLFSYCCNQTHITLEDMKAVCIDEAEDKVFDMLDAIGNRNQKKALQLYRDLLELRKPAMQILALLIRHFNILMQVSGLTGKDNKTIASLAGVAPYFVKSYAKQAEAYTFEQLKSMLEQCQKTDYEVKTGKIKDVVGVELLIVKFSSK